MSKTSSIYTIIFGILFILLGIFAAVSGFWFNIVNLEQTNLFKYVGLVILFIAGAVFAIGIELIRLFVVDKINKSYNKQQQNIVNHKQEIRKPQMHNQPRENTEKHIYNGDEQRVRVRRVRNDTNKEQINKPSRPVRPNRPNRPARPRVNNDNIEE